MTKSKTIKKTRKSKTSATWVKSGRCDVTYRLVPASMPDTYYKYPAFADMEHSPTRTTAYALGVKVLEIEHQKYDSDYYLEFTKDKVIEALHKWGVDIEVVEDIEEVKP